GLGGQFVVGALLGAMWSPCVGPTLGTASLLAAQGKDLWSVGATMAAFGLGAALPLAAIGAMSREALARRRGGFARTGRYGRTALGATALAASLLIVTGADRALESALVAASPAWLTTLTTRF
ncbi:MAG: cytochrome c biogenesis protein CcdA, partial [Hyphomicrobiales bacterium]|nr:cytochrome c biogenesis protein CcdA [Hyphomicrobiales bacterium]